MPPPPPAPIPLPLPPLPFNSRLIGAAAENAFDTVDIVADGAVVAAHAILFIEPGMRWAAFVALKFCVVAPYNGNIDLFSPTVDSVLSSLFGTGAGIWAD